jgi:hypothetical protein
MNTFCTATSASLLSRRLLFLELPADTVGLVKAEDGSAKRDTDGNLVRFEKWTAEQVNKGITEGNEAIDALDAPLEAVVNETRSTVSNIDKQLKRESLTEILQKYREDAEKLKNLPESESEAEKLATKLVVALTKELETRKSLLQDQVSDLNGRLSTWNTLKLLLTSLQGGLHNQMASVLSSLEKNERYRDELASDDDDDNDYAVPMIEGFLKTLAESTGQNEILFCTVVEQIQASLPANHKADLQKPTPLVASIAAKDPDQRQEMVDRLSTAIDVYRAALNQEITIYNKKQAEIGKSKKTLKTESDAVLGSTKEKTEERGKVKAKIEETKKTLDALKALMTRLSGHFESAMDQGEDSSFAALYLVTQATVSRLLDGKDVLIVPDNYAEQLKTKAKSSVEALTGEIKSYLAGIKEGSTGVKQENLAQLRSQLEDVNNTPFPDQTAQVNPEKAVQSYFTSCDFGALLTTVEETLDGFITAYINEGDEVEKAMRTGKRKKMNKKIGKFKENASSLQQSLERWFVDYLSSNNVRAERAQQLNPEQGQAITDKLSLIQKRFADEFLVAQALGPFISSADKQKLLSQLTTIGNQVKVVVRSTDDQSESHTNAYELERTAERGIVINDQRAVDHELGSANAGLLSSLSQILDQIKDNRFDKNAEVNVEFLPVAQTPAPAANHSSSSSWARKTPASGTGQE